VLLCHRLNVLLFFIFLIFLQFIKNLYVKIKVAVEAVILINTDRSFPGIIHFFYIRAVIEGTKIFLN